MPIETFSEMFDQPIRPARVDRNRPLSRILAGPLAQRLGVTYSSALALVLLKERRMRGEFNGLQDSNIDAGRLQFVRWLVHHGHLNENVRSQSTSPDRS